MSCVSIATKFNGIAFFINLTVRHVFGIIREYAESATLNEGSMKRRNFLSASAASMFGYSLIVSAPKGASAFEPTDERSRRLAALGASKSAPYAPNEKLMKKVSLECDVLVAGGGLAGICAAISAARHGKKVVLVQDRSRLGGNSSSEIKMHPLGVKSPRTGWREGGLIEELKLENAANNPQLSWEMWDLLLYDKCVSEKNITLILDTSLCGVEMDGDKIARAYARSDTTRHIYDIKAKIFVDCTGDSRLAMEAGAEVMSGRDGSAKFGESFADFDPVGTRQGSSIMFTSKLYDKPMPYKPPVWAKKITPEQMKFRSIKGDGLAYGYWWIELGGDGDAIADNEMLRFELLSIVMGVWDYIKNSGKYPESANRAIDTVSMVTGRRDTYRIVGERVMTQQDIMGGWRNFDDAVAVGGWSMDDHPAKGFYASDRRPCRQFGEVPFYNIGLSSLYSKDVKNLMMAGRNISCSHVAFTSTRVMSTCAVEGQAVGTAASMCIDEGLLPAQLRADNAKLRALQQALLRDDQTIIGIRNEDPLDLARSASVSASDSADGSKPENVLTGVAIDSRKSVANRWVADASAARWLKLSWRTPVKISSAQLTFFGGYPELSMTHSDYLLKHMHRGAQKELVRDFDIVAELEDGSERVLAQVRGNAQRLVRAKFDAVSAKSLRFDFKATNGDSKFVVCEVRAYA